MATYDIEIVHELTGESMNFTFDSDLDEDQVYREILADISITAFKQQD